MENPRVIGAFVVGFAVVAGAYVLSDFGTPPPQQGTVGSAVDPAPVRSPIAVEDSNQDGLEDWRNSLEVGNPVSLSVAPAAVSDYVRPDTVTDDFSVQFFEQIIRSKTYGEFGSSEEEVIQKSIAQATQEASDTLFDTRDIVVIPDSEQTIRAYGNRAANIIMENNVENTENESVILKKALDRNDPSVLSELTPLSNMYATLRDEYLNTPVPQSLAKQHLDLINVYHVLHRDIEGMRTVFEDPLYTLVRIKRYQDDASGLAYALQNMYLSLVRTPQAFKPGDPAFLFISFAPADDPIRNAISNNDNN